MRSLSTIAGGLILALVGIGLGPATADGQTIITPQSGRGPRIGAGCTGFGIGMQPDAMFNDIIGHPYVIHVSPNGPAAAAGLVVGDTILVVNGMDAGAPDTKLGGFDPGTLLRLTVRRDAELRAVVVRVGQYAEGAIAGLRYDSTSSQARGAAGSGVTRSRVYCSTEVPDGRST